MFPRVDVLSLHSIRRTTDAFAAETVHKSIIAGRVVSSEPVIDSDLEDNDNLL